MTDDKFDLGEAAAQCGIRADKDRDLILFRENEVSLLEQSGGESAAFGKAIRDFRDLLPVIELEAVTDDEL